jgi:uncharacterized protein (TIGR02246 family)
MSQDETEIRRLVSTWMSASKAGDVTTILSLMTDDVVFLVPGKAPMRKADFEAGAKAQAAHAAPKFDGSSEIQEVQVNGDMAFAWAKLKVVGTPPDGSAPSTRTGHTLTVFKKVNGKWLLARDANLLGPSEQAGR